MTSAQFGRMDLMVLVFRILCFYFDITMKVEGAPPKEEKALWVANHFNWIDWPIVQATCLPRRVHTIVKADLAVESKLFGGILTSWCRNLGAILHTRGDRASGLSVRQKIAEHKGTVLVFPEGTTQAYGPPQVQKIRTGSFEAAYEVNTLVQPCCIYYSNRIGCGWGPESNALTQTSVSASRPMLAVVKFCSPVRPKDFKDANALSEHVKKALHDGYLELEAKYKDYAGPSVDGRAVGAPVPAGIEEPVEVKKSK